MRLASAIFVCGIAFGGHLLHDALFCWTGDGSGQVRFDYDFVLLIFEENLGLLAIAVINLGDGEATFDGVAEIDGLPETKIHGGCEPAELTADFGEQAGNQEPVADWATKFLRLGETLVKMDGVIIAADFREGHRVLFGERARDGERVPWLQACDCFYAYV
jgi:hypothetical protein